MNYSVLNATWFESNSCVSGAGSSFADKISVVFVLPQCSWPAATASPSTAWPVYASSSSPLLRKSTTFPWLTPAITCWTCPATRPKRPCGTGSHKPWSSTKDSVWSERETIEMAVCMLAPHFKPVEKRKRTLLSHLFYHRRARPESHASKSIIFLFLQTDSWLAYLVASWDVHFCFVFLKFIFFKWQK